LLLVVIDTLRADAVSVYGAVEGTTPAFDELARAGRLYTRAYAPSPWTLPSHASLLSGLDLGGHGVGIGGRVVLPGEIETLAERLQAAGYQTAAFSENALVSGDFGFDQGFDHFAVRSAGEQLAAGQKMTIDVEAQLSAWLDQRDPERPFFVFINLYDAHEPYAVRDQNPFLPPGVTTEDARGLRAGGRTSHLICDRLPAAPELGLLRGLYLGEVAEADRKLGAVLEILQERGVANLVTVVTSDHGEHFGERRLLDHEFSIEEEVLRVPLVVRGPGSRAETIDRPIELRDVARSLLAWAGASTDGLASPGLDQTAAAPAPAPLLAVYSDNRQQLPAAMDPEAAEKVRDFKRQGCGDADRVFGDMLALTRYPFRLKWYARYPSELVDLRRRRGDSPGAMAPLAGARAALEAEAQGFALGLGLGDVTPGLPLPERSEEALRSLGYSD
jgi:arylsulfatase A-like enzyme